MTEIGKNLPELSRTDMQPQVEASAAKQTKIKLGLPSAPSKPLELTSSQLEQISKLNEPSNPINAALISNAQGTTPSGLEKAVGALAARVLGG